jgi:hypothetical protein
MSIGPAPTLAGGLLASSCDFYCPDICDPKYLPACTNDCEQARKCCQQGGDGNGGDGDGDGNGGCTNGDCGCDSGGGSGGPTPSLTLPGMSLVTASGWSAVPTGRAAGNGNCPTSSGLPSPVYEVPT